MPAQSEPPAKALPASLADQIKNAKLNASKPRAETARKAPPAAQPSFQEEMAQKLKKRESAPTTDVEPSPSSSRKAPPPVTKKKKQPAADVEPPAPRAITPEIVVAPTPAAAVVAPTAVSAVAVAEPPAPATESLVDWAAFKTAMLDDVRAQLATFTESLLEGLGKSIDAQIESQSSA
jgi:hypothetical protein